MFCEKYFKRFNQTFLFVWNVCVCAYLFHFNFFWGGYFWSYFFAYMHIHMWKTINKCYWRKVPKEVVTYMGISSGVEHSCFFFFFSWDSFWNNSPYCKKLMEQNWLYFRNPVCKRKVKRLVNILLRRWFSFTLFTYVQITDPLLTWWG